MVLAGCVRREKRRPVGPKLNKSLMERGDKIFEIVLKSGLFIHKDKAVRPVVFFSQFSHPSSEKETL